MTITAGIDVGARSTRAALLEDGGSILAVGAVTTGFDYEKAGRDAYAKALAAAGLAPDRVSYVTATGFGRYRISFRDLNVTDITANARGAQLLFPGTRSAVDVGAGNARAFRIDERGKVLKFRSTEKCAAGGGGFLEKIAYYTRVDLDDLGRTAMESTHPVSISTICSVLAESEVINLVTQEVPMVDILMGAHESIAGRVLLTLRQVGVEPQVTLTGGLVLNPAFVRALQDKLGVPVNASPRLFYAGALGAALLGQVRWTKKGATAG
ncbi:MAG TPA: acyl-CoA dehydratase activase [Thermoplasmata archaeon]|nr:acyl-CoA dehydratase activase [Thermoplasmata archaeon]